MFRAKIEPIERLTHWKRKNYNDIEFDRTLSSGRLKVRAIAKFREMTAGDG